MDNNLDYSIRIIPEGVSEIEKLPAVIGGVERAVEGVNSATNPLSQIVRLLTNIQTILFEFGKVGVEQFNKLDQILVTNQEGFRKGAENADKLEKEIKEIGTASKKAGGEVQNGLLEKLANFGQAFVGIKSAAQTIIGAVAPIFQEGMARENAVSDFTTLFLGDKKAAVKYATELRETAAATLYGAGTINENAKSMIAYGVDADSAKETLLAIGDIAMGDKNKMNSLAVAFSQMSSLGKLQNQDWKQMVGAGFNPLLQMQKDLGKTQEELDKMMSKGLITSDMVKQSFKNAASVKVTDIEGNIVYRTSSEIKDDDKFRVKDKEGNIVYKVKADLKKDDEILDKNQFFGALDDTLNNTASGKLAALQSAFDDLKAQLFETLAPVALKIFSVIKDKIMPIIERLIPVVDGIMAVVVPLIEFIGDHIDTILTMAAAVGVVIGIVKAWIAVQTVINAVLTVNPIGIVVMAIAAMVAIVAVCIEKWDEWGQIVILLCGPLGWIVSIIQNIKKHWDSIVAAFESGGIIGGIKRIGIVLLDCVLSPLGKAMDYLAELTGWQWVKDFRNTILLWRSQLDLLEVPEVKDEGSEDETKDTLEDYVNGGGGGGGGGGSHKQDIESVASGGTRNTQITINLDNMVETVNFNGTPADNNQSVIDKFTEQLLRVLYSAQTAV